MGSAAVTRPPSRDFIRVYHVTQADYAVSAIALGRLKVARFGDLNDPFELLATNFRKRTVRAAINNFKSNYGKRWGLLCFSSDWTNPVLWSHYGSKHAGICLGFNLRREQAEKVTYVRQRIAPQLSRSDPATLTKRSQKKLLCTKFSHWKYEGEYRKIVSLADAIPEGPLHFWKFDGDLELAEVILGPVCTHSVDVLRGLVSARYPNVVTFGARLAYKWFSVVPEESSVL